MADLVQIDIKKYFPALTSTYHEVERVAKVYPKFVDVYEYTQSYIIQDKPALSPVIDRNPDNVKNDYLHDSIRRSKQMISDYILCNDFDMFATFTFNPKKIDRVNPVLVKKTFSKWLDNQKKKHGNFDYLVVPELHKDGKALHFHALFKGYKGSLSDSGKKINGRVCYNIDEYKLGFNSVVMIDNIEKVSSYVKKYITKDMPQFANKRRYWASKGLKVPQTVINPAMRSINTLKGEYKASETYVTMFYRKTRYYTDDASPLIHREIGELDAIRHIFRGAHYEIQTPPDIICA